MYFPVKIFLSSKYRQNEAQIIMSYVSKHSWIMGNIWVCILTNMCISVIIRNYMSSAAKFYRGLPMLAGWVEK